MTSFSSVYATKVMRSQKKTTCTELTVAHSCIAFRIGKDTFSKIAKSIYESIFPTSDKTQSLFMRLKTEINS